MDTQFCAQCCGNIISIQFTDFIFTVPPLTINTQNWISYEVFVPYGNSEYCHINHLALLLCIMNYAELYQHVTYILNSFTNILSRCHNCVMSQLHHLHVANTNCNMQGVNRKYISVRYHM